MIIILTFFVQFFYEYFWSIRNKEGFSISPMLTRAKSRGTVRLQSPDPYHHPIIDPNYLSHPHDVATLVKGQPGHAHHRSRFNKENECHFLLQKKIVFCKFKICS